MLNIKQIFNQVKQDIKDKTILDKYLFVSVITGLVSYIFIYSPQEKKLKNARRRASSLYRKLKYYKRVSYYKTKK